MPWSGSGSAKTWLDYPNTTTPLNSAGITDLESRLGGYTDRLVGLATASGSAVFAQSGGTTTIVGATATLSSTGIGTTTVYGANATFTVFGGTTTIYGGTVVAAQIGGTSTVSNGTVTVAIPSGKTTVIGGTATFASGAGTTTAYGASATLIVSGGTTTVFAGTVNTANIGGTSTINSGTATIALPSGNTTIVGGTVTTNRINFGQPNNVFTRVTGAPWLQGLNAAWASASITTVNVGDVVLVALLNGYSGTANSGTVWASNPSYVYDSSNRVNWDTAPLYTFYSPTDASTTLFWKGVVTSAGATTVYPVGMTNSNLFTRICVDEWKPSWGSVYSIAVLPNLTQAVNTKDQSNGTATTAVAFAPVTSPPSGGLYWAFHWITTVGSSGSTPGFVYSVTTGNNLLCANGTLSFPGSTLSPTATLTSGWYGGIAMVLAAQ